MAHHDQLAETLRSARAQQKLGLRAVAREVGISAAMLSKIETGKVSTGSDTLVKLAKILHLDPDDLALQAGKIPPDVESALLSSPRPLALRLIRKIRDILSSAGKE